MLREVGRAPQPRTFDYVVGRDMSVGMAPFENEAVYVSASHVIGAGSK